MKFHLLFVITIHVLLFLRCSSALSIVINTWPWTAATDNAYNYLSEYSVQNISIVIESVLRGCEKCEELQCDTTVGYGGSPDESGETTLDALIMNGDTMHAAAVADLKSVKQAIRVAKAVMDYTKHTLLVGESATQFALEMGFPYANLSTSGSMAMWSNWEKGSCQPNYRQNVEPDPTKYCGPYQPMQTIETIISEENRNIFDQTRPTEYTQSNHDTIAMIALGNTGSMAVGTSTNGARFKIPGRVGDGPIPGASAYAESALGGCAITGDGDLFLRFLPCFTAVELLRQGLTPQEAADEALLRITVYYPSFQAGLVLLSANGEYSGSSIGWNFAFSVRTDTMNSTLVVPVTPISEETIQKYRAQKIRNRLQFLSNNNNVVNKIIKSI